MEHMTTKEKLATMNRNEKLKYIWYYFKFHIIAVLVLIIGLSIFIYNKVTQKKTYCNITYVGNYMKDNSFESIKDSLNNALLKNDSKSTFTLNCDYLNAPESNENGDIRQKVVAEIAAKDIDIAIVSKEFFDSNLNQDIFLDLNSLQGFKSLKISDNDIVKAKQSDKKKCTYGILVNNMKILNKVNFNKEDQNILVVIANATHKDAAMKTIKLFTNNK